jgi:hypothetical protein
MDKYCNIVLYFAIHQGKKFMNVGEVELERWLYPSLRQERILTLLEVYEMRGFTEKEFCEVSDINEVHTVKFVPFPHASQGDR